MKDAGNLRAKEAPRGAKKYLRKVRKPLDSWEPLADTEGMAGKTDNKNRLNRENEMNSDTLLQITESYDSREDCLQAFTFQTEQDGYRGGRLLPPSDLDPQWRLQCFHDDDEGSGWLPDGCRRTSAYHSLRLLRRESDRR